MTEYKRTDRRFRDRVNRLKRQWAAKQLPCHLCEKPIDYSLPADDPMAVQADHLTAVAAGGHMLGPMAPGHAYCNKSRGSKDLEDYKAKRAQRHPAGNPGINGRTRIIHNPDGSMTLRTSPQ